MKTITDEMLSAYLDGELGSSQNDEVHVALSSDPDLRARLHRFEQADATMRAATSNLESRQIPDRISAMLSEDEASVANFGDYRRTDWLGVNLWPTALAASIALIVGWTAGSFYPGAPRANADDDALQLASRSLPGDPLFEALETIPSGQSTTFGDAGGSIQPVLSFASVSGEPCREFEAIGPKDAIRAVACREQASWRVDFAMRSASELDGNGFQTASSADSQLVSSYISGVMDGDAFGREVESRKMANGWRNE